MKSIVFIIVIISVISINYPVLSQRQSKRPIPVFKDNMPTLLLPNNATAIRENIVDTFSCENRIYGYYADVDNECQIFHVCLPQQRGSIRWSFICPIETVFNQETFVCTRINDSIPCEESEQYYVLNEELGKDEKEEEEREKPEENVTYYPLDLENEVPVTPFTRNLRRKGKSDRRGTSNDEKNKSNNITESSRSENSATTLRSTSLRQRLRT